MRDYEDHAGGTALFGAIASEFYDLVRQRDAKFLAIMLPRKPQLNQLASDELSARNIPLLSLQESLKPEKLNGETLFFKNDPHWNEEGNKWAAISIFGWLLSDLGSGIESRQAASVSLGKYYGVFDPTFETVTRTAVTGQPTRISRETERKLREFYRELE